MARANSILPDPTTIARLQGLELRARTIVEGMMPGAHRGRHGGFSIEFAEHREYTPGDDLRYVDWKVYGRTDKIYLKQYDQESRLDCYLLFDTSESMGYRSAASPLSKFEYARCTAAALIYLILQQQDSVGLVTFDQEVRSLIRARNQPAHWNALLQALEGTTASGKTATAAALHAVAGQIRRRSLFVLISDLLDDVSALRDGLRHLRHRRHEVIVLQLLDRAELDFPFGQPARFQGMEQLPDIAIDPELMRSAYLEEMASFRQAIRQACRVTQCDYSLFPTDEPLHRTLAHYLASRSVSVP